MKLIDNSFNSPTAGQPIRPVADLDWMQLNTTTNINLLLQSLIGPDYDNTKSYVLKGCIASSSGGTTSVTSGIIYGRTAVYGSMPSHPYLYFVPATSFADPSGGNVVVCNVLTIPNATWDPTPFTDGSNHNIHNTYELQFSAAASGSGFENYSALIFLSEYDGPAFSSLAVSTGAGQGTVTGTLYYRKNYMSNTLTIYGQLTSTTPSDFNDFPSTIYYTAGTLPVGFRPNNTKFFTAFYYLGSSIKNFAGDTYIDRFTCGINSAGQILIKWIKPDVLVGGYGINISEIISLY